jgi:hypothetical protein
MSRTDKHRPLWVQERDPLLRHEFRADHDHRDGVCDLEYRLAHPHARWSDTSCHLNFCGARQVCGCRACTAHSGRRRERRRVRSQGRALGRELVKDPRLEQGVLARPVVKEAWQSSGSRGRVTPSAAPVACCELAAPWPWVKEWWQAAWPGFVAPGRSPGAPVCGCAPESRR